MATLADELLNDFEDSGSDAGAASDRDNNLDIQYGDKEADRSEAAVSRRGKDGNGSESDDLIDEEMEGIEGSMDMSTSGDLERNGKEALDEDDEDAAKARIEKMQLGQVQDVRTVAGLMKILEPVLEKIAHFQTSTSNGTTTSMLGSVEDNPEYHLLTQSNTLSTSIDNEIILVHKFIRDHYSTRFPELEGLVQNPLDYAKTVAIIGNGPLDKDSIKKLAYSTENVVGLSLNKVLDGPSLMTVTVEASGSKGEDLSAMELDRVQRACKMIMSLDRAKKTLTDYVQSRMDIFAPNLTALIGSLTAAQLLNFAGGITGLAKTPACNLPPLGSKKQSQTGFATNVGIKQQGFLYHSPIIRSIPSHLKRQAMRIVSAKVVLAARVDRVHSSPDGSSGQQLHQDCLDRLEKLTEPPPNRGPRALPAPDDKPARKRGGRRARKAKEQTAMTDLRKEQNRMAFGKEEKEVGFADGTKGMGMIGQKNDGRIRNLQIDQRTKAKLSKNSKGWGGATPMGGASGFASSIRGYSTSLGNAATGLRTSGVGTSGTASTIAFTPVQGLELADPTRQAEMKRKAAAETDRWFKGGTFTQINNSNANGSGPASGSNMAGTTASSAMPPPPKMPSRIDKDGFKIPTVPAKST